MLDTVSILGVKVTNERKDKILEYLFNRLSQPHTKTFIITPNPEMVVYANRHIFYKNKLNEANISLPDGIGLLFAASFLGTPLKDRVTGVDFIEELCKVPREKPLSMGFLGGRNGVAELAAECLKKKYPWINVVFVSEEWSKEGFAFAENNSKVKLQKSKIQVKSKNEKKNFSPLTSHLSPQIDILFVAYGVPKQEEWIYDNLEKLPVKAAMGVGGAFDYLSGNIRRAPWLIRWAGFEWLFRLVRQPWRFKRQLALLAFIKMVFQAPR